MKRTNLLILVTTIAVLCFTTAGYCSQPEIKEKGDLTFGGNFTVEFGHAKTDYNATPVDTDENDTSAEFVLEISAGLTKELTGDAVIEYKEGDDDSLLSLDEAYLSIVCPKTGIFYSHFGKMYIPFADADSSFITGPWAEDLGETRETVITVGAKVSIIDFEFGVFNGDNDKAADNNNNTDDYFAALVVTPVEGDALTLSLSVAYLSDLSDTDANLIDTDADPDTFDGYTDRTGGFSYILSAVAETGYLIAEYVVAEDDFNNADTVAGITTGAQPEALSVELGATMIKDTTIALRYESTDEFTMLATGGDTDITRMGIMCGRDVSESVYFALEYMTAEDDKTDNKVDTVTAQVELAF